MLKRMVLFVSAFVMAVSVFASAQGLDIRTVDGNLALMQNGLPYPTNVNDSNRERLPLDGDWLFRADPDDVGLSENWQAPNVDRSKWSSISVPGTWNTEFRDTLWHYKGVGWYATTFDTEKAGDGRLARLAFMGVFLESEVWLNGVKLGSHSGGYTPFYLDATDALKQKDNVLIVRVDSRLTFKNIPNNTSLKKDLHGWWPYGGIHRSVYIEYIQPLLVFKADIRTQMNLPDADTANVAVAIGVYNSGDKTQEFSWSYRITGPGAKPVSRGAIATGLAGAVAAGEIEFLNIEGAVSSPERWSHDTPENIYTLTVDVAGENGESDSVSYTFGIRTIDVTDKSVVINGKPVFLRGISRHEDSPETGLAQILEHITQDVELMRELNLNHIRPGHYPCSEDLLDLLQSSGITVTEEIPAYQTDPSSMADPELVERARIQLIEMIERDRNRPEVIIWSVANEIVSYDPSAGPFVQALHDTAKQWDPTRPTTMAVATIPFNFNPDYSMPIVDIISINEYYGWYYDTPTRLGKFLDALHKKLPGKPFIISEFGAGALYGRHTDKVTKEPSDDHSYSEEFQAALLKKHFQIILERDYITGTMPWAFADFNMEWHQSTGRPHPIDEVNLKGLLTMDREKKLAFDVVADIYKKIKDKALAE